MRLQLCGIRTGPPAHRPWSTAWFRGAANREAPLPAAKPRHARRRPKTCVVAAVDDSQQAVAQHWDCRLRCIGAVGEMNLGHDHALI